MTGFVGIAKGSFKGRMARGGFSFIMEWKNDKVTRTGLTSTKGGLRKLRVQDGREFKVSDAAPESKEVASTAGNMYTISF